MIAVVYIVMNEHIEMEASEIFVNRRPYYERWRWKRQESASNMLKDGSGEGLRDEYAS